VLPLFHQLRVTLVVLLEDELVLLVVELLLLLQAAIVSAAATAMAAMAGFLEPRMRSHLLMMPRTLRFAGSATGRAFLTPPGAAESGGRASRVTSA
jgi:hypothetical protein